MQHAGNAHVVDELLVAERLFRATQARGRVTDTVAVAVRLPVSIRESRISPQPELFAEE
jgi:hypothetical protein